MVQLCTWATVDVVLLLTDWQMGMASHLSLERCFNGSNCSNCCCMILATLYLCAEHPVPDCPHHVPATPASDGAGCAPLACAVGGARSLLLFKGGSCWAQSIARGAMACTSAVHLPGRMLVRVPGQPVGSEHPTSALHVVAVLLLNCSYSDKADLCCAGGCIWAA